MIMILRYTHRHLTKRYEYENRDHSMNSTRNYLDIMISYINVIVTMSVLCFDLYFMYAMRNGLGEL